MGTAVRTDLSRELPGWVIVDLVFDGFQGKIRPEANIV